MVALIDTGKIYTWGDNIYGKLGIGTSAITEIPTEVTGVTDVVDIGASYLFSAAVKNDGTVWVWGRSS